MKFFCSILTVAALTVTSVQATPAEAASVRKAWKTAYTNWAEKARLANTPEARAEVIEKRPDASAYVNRMWTIIGPSLDADWTLEPASWYLVMLREQIISPPDPETAKKWNQRISAIREALVTHHLKSPKLAEMCMALARINDPVSLQILEKIETANPDSKIQGVAALGVAISLRTLGDNPDLIRRRLTYLRKAIIESSDVSVGETTVAKIAENELYQIRYLSKGRVAPNLSGTDADGQAINLSSLRGKVVVLMFWSSTIPLAEQTIEITNEMVKKFEGKAVEVIGVNHDPVAKLKAMSSDGTISWKNFSDPDYELAKEYRVGTWPAVYVLDQNRKIHYVGTQGTFAELTAEALISE